jgi:hypothetical protein
MKRLLIILGAGLILLFFGAALGIFLWIGHDVKENIKIAKSQYPGKAEDALIAYLLDSIHSPRDRTHLAVWTLGQIHSKKALPVLRKFYRNDPKGLTCKHNTELCQYGIYKAIRTIEGPGWPSHQRLNK